ncbi:hypothetical protein GCM10022280_01160 [Sphingomonas swuensis]|uniref:DUF1491 domain-containing protein n=1 Tax=Sphingomonas swuensis TaxID=977800 RepID=A0ABP7S8J8_9SPHN
MSDARLAAQLEASALLARAQAAGGFGAVLHRGDPERGAILLVLLERGQPMALVERSLDAKGIYAWSSRPAGDSANLDQHVARARRNDPDLWTLELDVPSAERFIAEMI